MPTPPPVPVLIVDDQAPFRLAAAAVLRATPGFELVGSAEDGEAAVRQVGLLQPGLVLMDLRMPGVDGLTATRRIVDAWPDTRVFLCSTYDVVDLPEQARSSGAVAYVHKEELQPALLQQLWSALPATPSAAAPRG